MTTINSGLARFGQGLTGAALLFFAIGASVVSLTINYRYGMQTSVTAAAIFLLADGAKFGLLIAIGAGQWRRGTRAMLWAVWLACFSTSLFAASNAYIDENAAELFARGHKVAAYSEAQASLADSRRELQDIRQRLAALTAPDTAGLAELAAQAKAGLTRAEADAAKADGELRKARGARSAVREEAAARAKAAATAEAARARADLARITAQLADAKRRDDLEKRRSALEVRLSGARTKIQAAGVDAKGQALGVVRLVSHLTGRDAGEVGQHIGLIKAGLFIVLMEALILLAAPGMSLLLAAIWPLRGPAVVNETPSALQMGRQVLVIAAPRERTAHAPSVAGTELKALREVLHESQEAFGARFRVGERTVRRWENGACPIPRKTAIAVRSLADRQNRRPHLAAVA